MSTVERTPQQIIDKATSLRQGGPKRGITLEFKSLLGKPDLTQGNEVEISAIVGEAIAYLSEHQGIYSEYGREDIIKGLGAIDHPAAQFIVADSLQDPSTIVAKTAERILLDPKRYIYPETFEELFAHSDPRVKELGLRIIEHNSRGGITPDGNVIPSVMQEVYNMTVTLEQKKRGDEMLRKGAILASLLHERTNGKIPETLSIFARQFLVDDIAAKIRKLRETSTFVNLVASIVAANETRARTATNIQELALDFPEDLADPKELTALVRLLPTEPNNSHETVVRYKSLVALTKERVREKLSTRVAQIKAREEKRQQQLQAQTEENNRQRQLELQEAQERQAQIRREQRLVELELVRKAHQWFPHL